MLLGILVVAGVFCLIFALAQKSIFDLDIWLHLKAGEVILQNKAVPTNDIFSYTIQGKPWVDHEWLFQVLVYWIFSGWQADGLIFLESMILVLAFLVLFALGRRSMRSSPEAALLLLLTAYASTVRFNIRPEIFSLLFFAIYLYVLKFWPGRKSAYLIIPVQILWVNLHGYFFLGPLLILIFITAEFLRRNLPRLPRNWKEGAALSDAAYRRLKIIFLFSALACLLNPAGLKGALYPLFVLKEVVLGRAGLAFKYIQELRPTFQMIKFSGTNPYYLLIAFCLAVVAARIRKLNLAEIVLFSVFFLLSLKVRNVAFFSFIMYAVISSCVSFGPLPADFQKIPDTQLKVYFILRPLLCAVFIVWVIFALNSRLSAVDYDFETGQYKSLLFGTDDTYFPKGAVDFILEKEVAPNIFNDFNSGSYLIGRGYPEVRVFIDGRTEAYGPEFFGAYRKIISGDKALFGETASRYKVNACLFSLFSGSSIPKIIRYIYQDPKWKPVFLDAQGIVFLKDVPQNKELIKIYGLDLKKYSVPQADLKSIGLKRIFPSPYIRRAQLFFLLKENDLAVSEAREALKVLPGCFEAYALLGKVDLRKKSYPQALVNLRSALLTQPHNTEALTELGFCLTKLKERKLALKTLKKAISIDPRYAPPYFYLGGIYLKEDNLGEAVKALSRAVQLDPEVAGYHYRLAEALFKQGAKLKDKKLLERARGNLKESRRLIGFK